MKRVNLPFIRAKVFFVDSKKGEAELKKVESGIDLRPNDCLGYATRMGLNQYESIYTIQIKPNQPKTKYINTVSHEISHVVNFMMEHNSFNDDELRSCLVGYLSEEFLKI